MPKLLVTGHAGFVGRHVLEQIGRREAGDGFTALTLPETLDLRAPELAGRVADLSPDAVLHLAALTSPADSFRNFDAYFDVNFRGTLNLLRALQAAGFRGRMVFVSSGDCYGTVAEAELPISEERPLRPRNPYAVSKVAAEALCYQWSQTEGLDVVIARPFNHIGPGQSTTFAIPDFAQQLARIRSGRATPVMTVGDVDVTRDFTDVRDVVRAYLALLERGEPGEVYNVCSGVERSLRSLLERLIAIAGVEVRVEVDQSRLRKAEQRRMRGSAEKIRRTVGWSPTVSLEESLQRILEHFDEGAG